MMIACSGQGTAPDNVSFARPGRFYVLQHLAASIPSRLDCENREGLSCDDLERSFDKHSFQHVIVCGHLSCRVIRHWLQPIKDGDSDVGGFRRGFENGARDLVVRNYSPAGSTEKRRLLVCEHVLCQIENLMTHSFILDRIKADRMSFHGWVVDDETAQVFGYDCEECAFVRL